MWISERDPAPQSTAESTQAVTPYCQLRSRSGGDVGSDNWSRPDAGEGQHGGLPQGTWSTQNLTTAPLYSSLWCALSCRHDTQGLLHSSKIWLKASSTCHQCVHQDIDFGAFALPFGGRLLSPATSPSSVFMMPQTPAPASIMLWERPYLAARYYRPRQRCPSSQNPSEQAAPGRRHRLT